MLSVLAIMAAVRIDYGPGNKDLLRIVYGVKPVMVPKDYVRWC